MIETKIKKFNTELNYIKNNDIRESAEMFIDMLPEYFYKISASSTEKYHPRYTIGENGLYRHTKAAVRIAKELLVLEMYQKIFTEEEQDVIYMSLMLHDGLKKGLIEEKYTRIDHPILMANFIKDNYKKTKLTDYQVQLAYSAISTHMGQWTTDFRGNEVLEKPKNKFQKFVHLCDYLASRKFLNIDFDENNEIID